LEKLGDFRILHGIFKNSPKVCFYGLRSGIVIIRQNSQKIHVGILTKIFLSKAAIDSVREAEMAAESFKNSCRNSDRNFDQKCSISMHNQVV
jgi:hypothetical protein